MKYLIKVIKDLFIGAWIIVAIFVTVCLLSYNEFNIPVFGKTTLLVIDNDELEPEFNEGDLLIIKRESNKKINAGDRVFFYNGNKANEYLINIGEVTDKNAVTSKETTYNINNTKVSGSYVIGRVDATKISPNVGRILGIFLSKWGYMFLVIFPTIFAIIYEILMIVDASKTLKPGTDNKNEKVSVDA
ncbi:type I signal peptidase [Clostridium sp. CAG:1193]|nr:type I signal peptidase [Clostridium sp. CAG:1193]